MELPYSGIYKRWASHMKENSLLNIVSPVMITAKGVCCLFWMKEPAPNEPLFSSTSGTYLNTSRCHNWRSKIYSGTLGRLAVHNMIPFDSQIRSPSSPADHHFSCDNIIQIGIVLQQINFQSFFSLSQMFVYFLLDIIFPGNFVRLPNRSWKYLYAVRHVRIKQSINTLIWWLKGSCIRLSLPRRTMGAIFPVLRSG